MKKIIVTAGGTGGHVFPALAVSLGLIKNGHQVIWVGSTKGIESQIVPHNQIPLERIAISGLRKKGLRNLIKFPFIVCKALYLAFRLIKKYRPEVVISFGGYVSFPVSIATKLYGIPLLIHEQNSIVGLTNKLLFKFANVALVAYKNVFPSNDKVILVGNPVRDNILDLQEVTYRYNCRSGGLKILVLGGSLGAKVFNDNLPYMFKYVNGIDRVIHQVGRGGDTEVVQRSYDEAGVNACVVEFIDSMAYAYSEADLVICRSGALTVSEICAAGLAAVFVPYPHAVDDHQKFNALPLVEIGAACMLLQKDFSVDNFVNLIAPLNREKCMNMALKARQSAILDSRKCIIEEIEKFL